MSGIRSSRSYRATHLAMMRYVAAGSFGLPIKVSTASIAFAAASHFARSGKSRTLVVVATALRAIECGPNHHGLADLEFM